MSAAGADKRLSSMGSFSEEGPPGNESVNDANWAVVVSSDDGISSINAVTKDGVAIDYNDLSAEERFQLYSAIRQAGDRLWVLLVRDAATVAFFAEGVDDGL